MTLKEFIQTALSEIVAGVAEARTEAETHGARVGSMKLFGDVSAAKIIVDENEQPVSMVEFDVALSETKGSDTKGGIGVFLGAVGLGSQGSSHGESVSNSRVKFSVPVVLPGDGS